MTRKAHDMSWTFEVVHGPTKRPLGGLAWDGKEMLASDVSNNTILAYDPASGETRTKRKWTNRVNGIAFGLDGALYGCQEGSRRILRMLPDGKATITTTEFHGAPHNHPNLITVGKRGDIWFSDCHHPVAASGPAVFPMLDHQSVLRLEQGPRPQSHWHIERMTFDTLRPRGVALSPDEKTLYVADTDNEPGGRRELRAYPVLEDGTLGRYTLLHTFGADGRGVHRGIEGICVDAEGRILACAGWERSGPGPMVMVFSPRGAVLASHPLPVDAPVNCAFGGTGLATLYVTTAQGHLLRAQATGLTGLKTHLPAA
jgi:gluconolactonase